MEPLYPLRFTPLFRRYLWGGRRLADVLGKPIGGGNDYAESWEVVDREADQSHVANGPLHGETLSHLVATRGPEIFGCFAPSARFPLLFKFLDAQRDLSVQVHPNDAQAAQLVPPDLGKTEAWVILDAKPDSRLYVGLKQGTDRAAFERAVLQGTCESCLHVVHPQLGECYFLPAGVVHALGAGLLVAEIQQSSDTTYRVFDWNRVGPDGMPRALHTQQALAVTDFNRGPISAQQPLATNQPFVKRLVACDKFVLDRWQFDAPQSTMDDNRFHLVVVLEGTVMVSHDPSGQPLVAGEVVLIPASLGATQLNPLEPTQLLDIYLPS